MIERKSGLPAGYQLTADRGLDESEKGGRVPALDRGMRRPADLQRQPLALELRRTQP